MRGALGNGDQFAFDGPGIEPTRAGRLRVSGSAIISFQCATQPTVRASAKIGANIAGGQAQRAEDDTGIKFHIGIKLAIDEIITLEGHAFQLHCELQKRIVPLSQGVEGLVATLAKTLARGS